MIKILIFILISSLTFSKEINSNNATLAEIDILKNEIKNIKDPILKKELEQIYADFQKNQKNILHDYKEKMKPLMIKRDKEIEILKNELFNKRELLLQKYGKKPKKLKKKPKTEKIDPPKNPVLKVPKVKTIKN